MKTKRARKDFSFWLGASTRCSKRSQRSADISNASKLLGALAVPITEAAKLLGVSRSLLYLELDRGNLRSAKVGKRRLIPVAEVHAYLQRHLV